MRIRGYFLFLVMFAFLKARAFTNLDFETVSTNRVTPLSFPPEALYGLGPVEDLLPGWQQTRDGVPVSRMLYNAPALGANFFGITSRQNSWQLVEWYFDRRIRQGMTGDYGVFVNAFDATYAISQRGDVPADATHLNISAWVPRGMELDIRLDGQLIVGGDVSPFAGRSALLELSFYSSGVPFSSDGYNIGLDYIQFVPEPSTWALLGMSAALFAIWSWWRRYQP